MKIFTRSESQGVVIDGNMHVTVIEIADTFVRVAIHSPEIPGSYREEIITLADDQAEPQADYLSVAAESVG